MTRYEELQRALVWAAERDGARLARFTHELRIATSNMLRALVVHLREYLGRPGERGIAYLSDPKTGDPCADDETWGGLIPESYPLHGNGYHTRLDITITWPSEDRKHKPEGLYALVEVVPLEDGRWLVAFEKASVKIDANDPATFDAFAEAVCKAVRRYFDAYALPPTEEPKVGFLRRV